MMLEQPDRDFTCIRCGLRYDLCGHMGTALETTAVATEHVARIRAAFVFGKRFNPDHNTTSYYDQTADENLKGVAYDQPDPETAVPADAAVGTRLPHAPEPKDLQDGH